MTNRKRIKTKQKNTTPAAYGCTQERHTSSASTPTAAEQQKNQAGKKQIIRFAFVFIAIANDERSVYEMQCNLLPNLFDLLKRLCIFRVVVAV